MKIGEREPTASGSFQPGIGGVGINPLVNTQFTYIDVGVNVELTARVHDNNEVSMHIALDISNITGTVNLGGINEPIIGQRKIDHDLRMREGEVALLGGLINQQDDKTITGIPGLSSIPLLGKLFSGSSVDHNKDELMIILVPHIVRRPEITPENIRAIAVGNATTISLHHAPRAVTGESASDSPLPPAPAVPAVAIPGVVGIIPAETKTERAGPAAIPNPAAAVPPRAAPSSTAPPSTVPPASVPASPATLPPATAPPLPPGITAPPTGGVATAPVPPSAQNAAAAPAPPATGQVLFNPPQVTAAPASNFAVALVLQGASDVASAPLQLSFDPKMLRLNDVTMGDLMVADGQQPAFSKNIQNDTGQATIQLSRAPGAPGVTKPSGILVYLNFQAIGHGTTTITAPGIAIRNTQNQVVAGGNPQVAVNIK